MAVNLSPVFNDAQLDSSGNPFSGALLFTYTAGSANKLTTYKDSAGGTPHANPIELNARGEPPAPIWLTAGNTYKFRLCLSTESDPPSTSVRDIDNVSGTNDTTVTVDQWAASGLTPTYVSATQFTLAGDQTTAFHVGRRLKTTNSGGTIYSTITVSAYGALTTVTVVNDSGTLDAGLSAVSYGIQTVDNPSEPVLTDTYPLRSGSSDKTKKVRLEVDGLTTATTRVLTVQDSDDTLVGRATTDTLTNKTLTAPALNGALSGDAIAAQAEMETGTATDSIVSPGNLHYHPSSSKAWVKFNSSGAVLASHNITSVTDTDVGNWTVNIATDFSSANYCGLAFGGRNSGSGNLIYNIVSAAAAGTFNINSYDAPNVIRDPDTPNEIYAVFYGDQA